MITIALSSQTDRDGFFAHARDLLRDGVPPDRVLWQVGGQSCDLFAATTPRGGAPVASMEVDRPFATALLHNHPERFGLLYRLMVRRQVNPHLLSIASDPDVFRLSRMEREVRRDSHKMRAFLRFRQFAADDGAERFVAWFEPEHHIVEANAGFFIRRFANMRWSIVTPSVSAHYDGQTIAFGPGGERRDVPEDDALDEAWRRYYAAIFNPARLMVRAMKREMPERYWKNLPEARLIRPMIAGAARRAETMIAAPPSLPRAASPVNVVPAAQPGHAASIMALNDAVRLCRRCPLHCHATQAVCGEGPVHARVMIVAEQPGDQEDLAGRPLIGPAGHVFDAALKRVGLDRSSLYVTNAVKHFKFQVRGKRRIHQRPTGAEISHCKWWLMQEIDLVRPTLVVAMGATALHALTGEQRGVTDRRGGLTVLANGLSLLPTVHPSYLLRLTDPEEKRRQWRLYLEDLARIDGAATAAARKAG